MLRALSVINVADRSGARTAKIRYLLAGTGSHLYAGISDRVGVNIKTIHYFQKKRRITHKRRRGLWRGLRRLGYVVRTTYQIPYLDVSILHFKENSMILMRRRKHFRSKKTTGITSRYVAYYAIAHKFRIHL